VCRKGVFADGGKIGRFLTCFRGFVVAPLMDVENGRRSMRVRFKKRSGGEGEALPCFDEWTDERQQEMEHYQTKYNIFNNGTTEERRVDE